MANNLEQIITKELSDHKWYEPLPCSLAAIQST